MSRSHGRDVADRADAIGMSRIRAQHHADDIQARDGGQIA
jgi:hypothetical protein